MYLYLYDSFLNHSKFQKILNKIENRLTDLGIFGKVCRLSPFQGPFEPINDQIKKGIKTIVIVGNDYTVTQIINHLVNKTDLTLGIIPLGDPNQIATTLGIPRGELACDILSRRKIEKIDLGKANHSYFFHSAKVSSKKLQLECDDSYLLTIPGQVSLEIYNFLINTKQLGSPQDGVLDTLIEPKDWKNRFLKFLYSSQKNTILHPKKIKIISPEPVPVMIDNQKNLETPITIEIIPQKLTVIVGKNRQF